MEEDSAPCAQVLLTAQVTHLCISSSGSLLDLSRVYHLIYKVWPEPSHLFYLHYCHARPSSPQLIPLLATYTHMNRSLTALTSDAASALPAALRLRGTGSFLSLCIMCKPPFQSQLPKAQPHPFCSSEMLE